MNCMKIAHSLTSNCLFLSFENREPHLNDNNSVRLEL